MSKKLIERLAREVAKEMYVGEDVAYERYSLGLFADRFLARYLEERGKEAVDAILVSDTVASRDERYGYGLFASYDCIQKLFLAPPPIPEGMAQLVNLIKDDAYAMTFQSLGQYRSALIKAAAAGVKP